MRVAAEKRLVCGGLVPAHEQLGVRRAEEAADVSADEWDPPHRKREEHRLGDGKVRPRCSIVACPNGGVAKEFRRGKGGGGPLSAREEAAGQNERALVGAEEHLAGRGRICLECQTSFHGAEGARCDDLMGSANKEGGGVP